LRCTTSRHKPRTYDKEFKLNAVKLYQFNDKSYDQLSSELDIPANTLFKWVHVHKKEGLEALPGKDHLRSSDAEYAQLRKELAVTREERDI
jgi:transposase